MVQKIDIEIDFFFGGIFRMLKHGVAQKK